MKAVEARFPATQEYQGTKLFIQRAGKRLATPLFFVIIALGTTDLLFALDSIPAIYGLTREPYIVLVANLFALMGLRQLYFLLGGLLKKLVYLNIGLAVLLAFIGVKLLLHALHENELPFVNGGEHVPVPEIPIWMSLGAIVVILGTTTAASLWHTRRHPEEFGEDTGPRRTYDDPV
jgi:tellurite resistance protein TerC